MAMVIAATGFGFALVQLDVTIVNVALPRIGSELSASVAALQWVVNAYAVAFSVCLLTAGSIGDRVGAKKIYLAGFALFTAASLGCGFSRDIQFLILSRAIQGVGAALMLPNSLTLLNHFCIHDPKLRARSVGHWTAVGGFTIAAGPLIGGLLLHLGSWRNIFFVNVPLAVIGVALTLKVLEETEKPEHAIKTDWAGQVSSVVALTALNFAFIEARPLGLMHPLVLGSVFIAVLSAAAFIWSENRAVAPMLPLQFFKLPGFSPAVIYGVCVNFAYYGLVFVLSLYLQEQLHYSPLQAGLAYIPLTATFMISNVVSGSLTSRHGSRYPMVLGGAIATIGFGALAVVGEHTSFYYLLLPFVLLPLGIGLGVPAMTNCLLSLVDKRASGVATGVLNAARQAGGAIGVAVFGAVVSAFPHNLAQGVRWDAIAAALLMLGIAALARAKVRPHARATAKN
jgi:DHA2 family methylenomycin A resistance protein-like MFS transporter